MYPILSTIGTERLFFFLSSFFVVVNEEVVNLANELFLHINVVKNPAFNFASRKYRILYYPACYFPK